MNSLKFTVHCGNYNPIPYKRTTQKQKFKDVDYKRYTVWKQIILAEFIKTFGKYPHQLLAKNKKYYVQILIYNKDKTHGDSDNQYKAVLDAIFAKPLNDKYIAGSMDYYYDKNNPRVEIEIRKDLVDVSRTK